jgi:MFS transporter, SP family, major inositol transporter
VFFLFAVIGVIALFFVITQVSETRGRSLATLEEDVETVRILNIRRASRVH